MVYLVTASPSKMFFMKKNHRLIKLTCVLCLIILFYSTCSFAQNTDTVSNGYYIVYPEKLILRLYLSRKFAPFTVSSSGKEDLNYKTNSKLNLGAGFTYKAITLNLSYGFNFLNPDKGRGDTKGLDLQLHVYARKFALDIIGAFLRGYYLNPKDKNGLGLIDYYKRPDLHRNIVGISFFKVANPGKFSYRAAFNQKAVSYTH